MRDMMLLLAILAFVLVDVKFGHEEKALTARGPCSLSFPPNLNLGLENQTRYSVMRGVDLMASLPELTSSATARRPSSS